MRGTWTTVVAIAALAILGACGGGDDDTTDEPAAAADTDDGDDSDAIVAVDGGDDGGETIDADDIGDRDGQGGISEGGTATLTLENGESFEFALWCVLEPQESAGSEILFTLGSRDTPSLDVTQFGSGGNVNDIAVASVYGEGFETLWEASSFNEAFGGGFSLTLDGSTVTGSGSFYPEGDPMTEPVEGELVADC